MATDTAQSVIPVEAKQKLTDIKAATGNNPEATESASSPAVLAGDQMAPVASLPSTSVIANVQTTPEVLKSSSTSIADEKTISLEKQPESNPTLAALSTPASLAVEPAENKLPGKWSTPQINTQAGEVVQQVMRQMSATLQSGPSSMRLHLNPKELGVIDVQMIQSAQGVSVTFFAEQASTGRLLETQMNQLRQSLTDSGIQLSNLNIGQHGQPGQQGGSSKQGLPFAQYPNSGAARPETQAEIDSRLQPEQIAGQLQGVDYRI
jgi:flagellar hook-length control protein FliK